MANLPTAAMTARLALFVLLALAFSGCLAEQAAPQAESIEAPIESPVETPIDAPVETPAQEPAPVAPATEFAPITITSIIFGATVRDPLGNPMDLGFDTHHFDVPDGARSMAVRLTWIPFITPIGEIDQDVPAMDLNFRVVGPDGPDGPRSAGGFCTNFAPAPDPLRGACNRDRSEEAVVEGLTAEDGGQWHAYILAERAYAEYTLTITFA